MTTFVHTLKSVDVTPDMTISVTLPGESATLSPDDPAISAMTDLKKTRIITIGPKDSIEFAYELMKHAGIRMLVVADGNKALSGLITYRDIVGEKPITIMTDDKIARKDIEVQQVMTPLSELDPFLYSDVQHAIIKDVIIQLRNASRQHAIVIEKIEGDSNYFVRGIFSITQIGRLLGTEISPDGHIQSFAEFEKLIA